MLSYVPFALINSRTRDKNGAFALIYELSQIPGNKMLFFYLGRFPQKSLKNTYLSRTRLNCLRNNEIPVLNVILHVFQGKNKDTSLRVTSSFHTTGPS